MLRQVVCHCRPRLQLQREAWLCTETRGVEVDVSLLQSIIKTQQHTHEAQNVASDGHGASQLDITSHFLCRVVVENGLCSGNRCLMTIVKRSSTLWRPCGPT